MIKTISLEGVDTDKKNRDPFHSLAPCLPCFQLFTLFKHTSALAF